MSMTELQEKLYKELLEELKLFIGLKNNKENKTKMHDVVVNFAKRYPEYFEEEDNLINGIFIAPISTKFESHMAKSGNEDLFNSASEKLSARGSTACDD